MHRFMRRWIAAAMSLGLAGCATGSASDQVVSVTYQYTGQNRSGADENALLTAQDECFLAGYQYAQPAGPPNMMGDGVTISFKCIGLRN